MFSYVSSESDHRHCQKSQGYSRCHRILNTQIIFYWAKHLQPQNGWYVNHAGKYAFVHLDLIKDTRRILFLSNIWRKRSNPTGIISTKNSLVAVLTERSDDDHTAFILLDSSAMDVSINSAKIRPDAVEILPGLVPKIIHSVKRLTV